MFVGADLGANHAMNTGSGALYGGADGPRPSARARVLA
jgi:hypothetical protein